MFIAITGCNKKERFQIKPKVAKEQTKSSKQKKRKWYKSTRIKQRIEKPCQKQKAKNHFYEKPNQLANS